MPRHSSGYPHGGSGSGMMLEMLRRVSVSGVALGRRLRPLAAAPATAVCGDALPRWPWAVSVRGMRDYPIKLLMRNHNFKNKSGEVDKEWSLGIVLQPSEVKSLRDRNGDLSAAFGEFYKDELFLHNMHIPVWRNGLIGRPEPTRERKLLANKSELKKMKAFLQQPNTQLLPVRLEVGNTGWIKVIMAQCYKKNKADNRKRDDERDIKRQLRDW